MAASTVWSIQLKVMTASTAPKLFSTLKKDATDAAKATKSATSAVGAYETALKGTLGPVKDVSAGFRGATEAGRSFARTMRTVARASVGDLNGVRSGLAGVRRDALDATAAVSQMGREIRQSRRGGLALAGGALAGSLALSGSAALHTGISGAGDLQMAMVSIQNATGANPAQLEKLRQTAFDVSAATAQSVVNSANVMKVMATSGINDPSQLAKIALPAAKFADVQFLARGTSFEEGAKQAIQLAHLFQQYGGKGLTSMFDQATRVSMMMPDSLKQYVTQAGYYMPTFRRLGVSDEDSLVAGAFMDRMGLGRGKGGTGLQNFILTQMKALAITGHVQSGQADALGRLGLLNADGSSKYYSVNRAKYGDDKAHFDVFGSLGAINAAVQSRTKGLHGQALAAAQGTAITDIQRALNVQGGRIGFLGTPEAIEQLNLMLKQLKSMPGVDAAQNSYMDTMPGQAQLFKTNFQSLLTDVMWPWLTDMKETFKFLADKTHDIQAFLYKHPNLEKVVGAGLAIGTAGAGVAAAGLGMAVFGGMAGMAFPGLLAALAGMLPVALMITAAIAGGAGLIAAVILLATHAKDVGAALGDAAHWIVHVGGPHLVKAFTDLIPSMIRGMQTAMQHGLPNRLADVSRPKGKTYDVNGNSLTKDDLFDSFWRHFIGSNEKVNNPVHHGHDVPRARAVGRGNAGGGASGTTHHIVGEFKISGASLLGMAQHEIDAFAKMIGDRLADHLAHESMHPEGSTQVAAVDGSGASHFHVMQGVPVF